MKKFFLCLIAIIAIFFSFPSSQSSAIVPHDHPYYCVVTNQKVKTLANLDRKITITAKCNSPYGFRFYMSDPMNDVVHEDILSGDGPVHEEVTFQVNKYEFEKFKLKIVPALN